MKRIAIAAALALCATSAMAQDAKPAAPGAAPRHSCEPRPVYPTGASQLASENRRRKFESDLASYKTCMAKYIDEEKAATLSHQAAYAAAVAEYNDTMKAVNAAIEASREPPSGVR